MAVKWATCGRCGSTYAAMGTHECAPSQAAIVGVLERNSLAPWLASVSTRIAERMDEPEMRYAFWLGAAG
jgi:hypothetical protein